jgi:hypothetical protein
VLLQVAHTQAQLALIEARLQRLRNKIRSMDDNDNNKSAASASFTVLL